MLDTTTKSSQLVFLYGKKRIKYNLLQYERKTLEISVHPDCRVVIKAPLNSDIGLIENKINKRARWIVRQINYFNQFKPKTPDKCYVNGETHLYLGKQYRLKLENSTKESVKLKRGYFTIACLGKSSPNETKKLLYTWYLKKAHLHFGDSLNRCFTQFYFSDMVKPTMVIKKMEKSWGNLSSKNTLALNVELVKAPKECIDYVVTHELCHLIYQNHSSDFYKLLETISPKWKKVKHKLELSMI